jgi:hypothetical protein
MADRAVRNNTGVALSDWRMRRTISKPSIRVVNVRGIGYKLIIN